MKKFKTNEFENVEKKLEKYEEKKFEKKSQTLPEAQRTQGIESLT